MQEKVTNVETIIREGKEAIRELEREEREITEASESKTLLGAVFSAIKKDKH